MFGDDFPDAFAHTDGRSCKSNKTLLDLPAEILAIVCQTLSGIEIKRLRLVSRDFAEHVELRIDRVFISPNRANLDCLNSILDHPRYRLRVREIVWDDSELFEFPKYHMFLNELDQDREDARVALEKHLYTFRQLDDGIGPAGDTFRLEDYMQDDGLLTQLGRALLIDAKDDRSSIFLARNVAAMQMEDSEAEESYTLYQKLYQDEKEIIKRGWDARGFQRALTELPNLKRVTLTTVNWAPWNTVPVYDTPFSRALPVWFRKPSVPCRIGISGKPPNLKEGLPVEWRSYTVVMSLLAAFPVPSLQELAVETGDENIGLPFMFCQEGNVDFSNTLQVLSNSRLTKLKLSLINCHSPSPSACRMESLISAAPYLEELDLKFEYDCGDVQNVLAAGFLNLHFNSLKTLTLRYTNVNDDWLIAVVAQTKTLKSCILDNINKKTTGHLGNIRHDSPYSLFSRLKGHFNATSTPRPSFTWMQAACFYYFPRYLSTTRPVYNQLLREELDAFLYEGAEMPFYPADEAALQGQVWKPGFGRRVVSGEAM